MAGLVSAGLALGAVAAWADFGSGAGQTPLSAALGFTIHDDLTGNLEYNADPAGSDAGFIAHCNDYDSVKFKQDRKGNPMVIARATCEGPIGTVYVYAQFVDKGEPGTKDTVCILWSDAPVVNHNDVGIFIHDHGIIQNGNIQVHENPDAPGHWSGIMLGV